MLGSQDYGPVYKSHLTRLSPMIGLTSRGDAENEHGTSNEKLDTTS